MLLTELVDTYKGDLDPDIRGLTLDSRHVEEGYLFAAIPGSKEDGSRYIADAIYHGAAAILSVPEHDSVEAYEETGQKVAFIHDENPRRCLAKLAAKFYGRQPETLVAVTGTNGKTSTVYFVQQIWHALGHKAASLGTLGVGQKNSIELRSGSITTPDPVSLHAELADLSAAGVTHLAMEASSHGLHQNRLDGVRATAAGFTNLSHDHLDYHSTMDEYLIAKAHLFNEILQDGGTAVLNADIPEYDDLAARVRERGCRILSYGHKGTDIALDSVVPAPDGQKISITIDDQTYDLMLPLVGGFQVMNALCALGLVIAADKSLTADAVKALENLKGAPGRLQFVSGHPAGAVYVDYAHTPDALENVLTALRPHTAGRLVCVVGCGGDRDPHKRPVMGRIAAQLSDLAVITDDNPRSEDPASIRAQMMRGAENKAREIGDRHEAIKWAIGELEKGDVLVIAGKGHEQGQIIGDHVAPFDDVKEAENAIGSIKA